jgi:pimeloyl-ACP methyl ester carboxylesterase
LLARAGEKGPYVLAGHSTGAVYVLNFAKLFPEQVAGIVLLDGQHPDQYARLGSFPTFYATFRRVSALLPSLSRLGIGQVLYGSQYGGLPPRARDEQRAFWSTARHSRSVRDEFAVLRTALDQAQSLKSVGNTPLMVVTATRGADKEWPAMQDDLAMLSSNSVHRLVSATHAMLTEDERAAAQSSRAITNLVDAVRAGRPLA